MSTSRNSDDMHDDEVKPKQKPAKIPQVFTFSAQEIARVSEGMDAYIAKAMSRLINLSQRCIFKKGLDEEGYPKETLVRYEKPHERGSFFYSTNPSIQNRNHMFSESNAANEEKFTTATNNMMQQTPIHNHSAMTTHNNTFIVKRRYPFGGHNNKEEKKEFINDPSNSMNDDDNFSEDSICITPNNKEIRYR